MARTEKIKKLAGQFYEGIACAETWVEALDGLRVAADGGVFHHVAWDRHAHCVVSGVANDVQPAEKVREYETYHAANDPRIPIVMTMQVGGILLDHEHFSPRDMSRNAIYADWLAPLGYRHTLGVPVFDDGVVREWICVIREVGQRHFEDDTRDLLRALMPDLLRASRLRVHVGHIAAQAGLGVAALDALPQALVLVDAQCAVQYLNPVARKELARNGSLQFRHGRLHADAPRVQQSLMNCVVAACQANGGAQGGTLRLGGAHSVSAGAQAASRVVHVLPLQSTHPLAQWHCAQPYALLIWVSVDSTLQVSHIGAALGLTEVEARLALLLSQGRTVKDFAQLQGCSWHTARTHAKNLLRKTGMHRQAEIAVLVQSLIRG